MVYRGILLGQDPYEKSIEEIHTYKTTFKNIIIYLNNHWSSTKKHHHPFERSARSTVTEAQVYIVKSAEIKHLKDSVPINMIKYQSHTLFYI